MLRHYLLLPSKPSALSLRFLVDDVGGAAVIGSRLNNILSALADKRPIHTLHKKFLHERGASALVDLIDGAISEADYAARALSDRSKRQEAARQNGVKAAEEHAHRAVQAAKRDAAMQNRLRAEAEKRQVERRRYENTPEFIAKQKTKALLHKCGIMEHIETKDFKRLMPTLRKLDSNERLEKEDVVWLKVHSHRYSLAEVLAIHHRHEADVCLTEFRRGGDPWQAVNASGHLRKCNAAKEAIDLLSEIPMQRQKHSMLKSAVLTTQGGAMRDLERFSEAQQAGEAAHVLSPRDYRPCTLLGAVHIQQGNIMLGHEWYHKA